MMRDLDSGGSPQVGNRDTQGRLAIRRTATETVSCIPWVDVEHLGEERKMGFILAL